jgi:hypothetical protein
MAVNRKETGKVTPVELAAFGLLEGSILTLGGIVAPRLFRRIPSRDKAGRIFGQILKNWFWLGLGCLLTLTTGAIRAVNRTGPANPLLSGRVGLSLSMLGILGYFRLVLARMDAIRAGLNGPIENYPAESGPRAEFNRLHKRSTKLMQAVMGLGLGWLTLSLAFMRQSAKSSKS